MFIYHATACGLSFEYRYAPSILERFTVWCSQSLVIQLDSKQKCPPHLCTDSAHIWTCPDRRNAEKKNCVYISATFQFQIKLKFLRMHFNCEG